MSDKEKVVETTLLIELQAQLPARQKAHEEAGARREAPASAQVEVSRLLGRP